MLKLFSLLTAAAILAAPGAFADSHSVSGKGAELAKKYIIVDTHIDVPYRLQENFEDISKATESGDFDYPRAVAGGLDAAFMSIYVPAEKENNGAKALADELIDKMEAIAKNAPEKFAIATSVDDVRRNFAAGIMSLPLGIENGAPIEGDLANLKHFYDRGVRYITLTHSKSNHISDSSYDDNRQWGGLSDFGKRLVGEMNRAGVMIDVSHVSDDAFYQVLEISEAPVIASHSSARHFTPGWERNMSDDMIVKLAQQGGVIQINFGSAFLTKEASEWAQTFFSAREKYLEENGLAPNSEEASAFQTEYRKQHPLPYAELDDVLDHFDHVVELTGIDHVGIGSDFDGVGDSLPEGIKDVSQFPNLIDGLLARGYSKRQIKKILGGNVLRVWSKVENHAAKYQ